MNKKIGIQESADNLAMLLTQMCLQSEVDDKGENVIVQIPPTRPGVES